MFNKENSTIMKRCFLFLMAAVAIQVFAADYTYKYLVFSASDGTQTTVNTEGLTLSVENGSLVVTNSTGTTALTLSSLAMMQFAAEGTTTPIDQAVSSVKEESTVEVFNLSGIYKGTFSSISALKSSLGKGVFIVKQDGKSTKMIVK